MKYIVYAKYDNMKRFSAFSLEDGCCVGNLIYASVCNVFEVKPLSVTLQNIASDNKAINLVFQIRENGTNKVVFQSA